MAESLHSASWYAVANLRPKLLRHAEIHRRLFRGQVWYLLQDPASGRFHRLSPGAYGMILAMDGRTSVHALWQQACEYAGEDLPTQDEVVQLLSQLHAQDLLHCELSPDIAELFERHRKQKKGIIKRSFGNPLSMRFPLFDPDRLLSRWMPAMQPLFGWLGVALWLLVVIPALFLAGVYWPDLSNNVSDRILSAHNLPLLWLTFPLVKALHELGHGFAVKAWGGSVHETGLMLILFTPTPYVDASASYGFPGKWQRAVVGAAGILVETFLAALALYVWVNTEPGLIRAIAYNVMVIAGISTVLVNGNPLLRYDGYYVLADLIEIPNLAARGSKYLTYLSDKYLLGARHLQDAAETPGERAWFVGYTIAAFIYRVFITLSIIFFIAGEYFFFGVLVALWSGFTLMCVPLWKAVKHIRGASSLRKSRAYAVKISSGLSLAALALVFLLPLPFYTLSEGVVWLPENAIVRAGADGFFSTLQAQPQTPVNIGDPLALSTNQDLLAELAVQQAKVAELTARYHAEKYGAEAKINRAKAELILQQLQQEQEALKRAEDKAQGLIVSAKAAGVFSVAQAGDLPGRYFRKGEVIGYVMQDGPQIARVVVGQDDIDLVRQRTQTAAVRLSQHIDRVLTANVIREVPLGADQLPSRALSLDGGGKIAVDPKDSEGLKSLQRTFQFDLVLPKTDGGAAAVFGGRVFVRFDHGLSPLASQWYIRLRQLFLARFSV